MSRDTGERRAWRHHNAHMFRRRPLKPAAAARGDERVAHDAAVDERLSLEAWPEARVVVERLLAPPLGQPVDLPLMVVA